jgi:hypothetical protein
MKKQAATLRQTAKQQPVKFRLQNIYFQHTRQSISITPAIINEIRTHLLSSIEILPA